MRQALLVMGYVSLLAGAPLWAATTYTYQTIDPKPEWTAAGTTHLFIRGGNDLGAMVGQTAEANGSGRDWRFVPELGMMRWNLPKNTLHAVADINNNGYVVQELYGGAQTWIQLCLPTPCQQLPINNVDPRVERVTNSGVVIGWHPQDLPEFPGWEGETVASFLYNTVTKKPPTMFHVPDWPVTILTGYTDDGLFFGYVDRPPIFGDPVTISFWGDETQLMPFTIPGTLGNQPIAINNRNARAALAFLETDIMSVVVMPSGETVDIDVPDALSTLIADLDNRGRVLGSFMGQDGLWRGFVATPTEAPAAQSQAFSPRPRGHWLARAQARGDDPMVATWCAGIRGQYGTPRRGRLAAVCPD